MSLKVTKYSVMLTPNYYICKRVAELGIKRNLIGYYYLCEIMHLLINVGMEVKSFSKEVYPILAEKYGKNECTIERDIRNVINTCWDKSVKEKVAQFWDKTRPPRCHEFIYIVKAYILKDLK